MWVCEKAEKEQGNVKLSLSSLSFHRLFPFSLSFFSLYLLTIRPKKKSRKSHTGRDRIRLFNISGSLDPPCIHHTPVFFSSCLHDAEKEGKRSLGQQKGVFSLSCFLLFPSFLVEKTFFRSRSILLSLLLSHPSPPNASFFFFPIPSSSLSPFPRSKRCLLLYSLLFVASFLSLPIRLCLSLSSSLFSLFFSFLLPSQRKMVPEETSPENKRGCFIVFEGIDR